MLNFIHAGRTRPKLPAAVDRWDRTRAKCMTRPETISGVIGCRDRWHGIARHAVCMSGHAVPLDHMVVKNSKGHKVFDAKV